MSEPIVAHLLESQKAHNAYQLLSVLQTYAPNGAAQAQLSRMYNEAYKTSNGESDPVIKMLAGVLLDGLNHGNWPWVLKQVNFTGDRDTDEQLIVAHLLEAAKLARTGSGTAQQEVRDDTATLITNYGWQRSSVESYIDRYVNWPAEDAERQNGSRYSKKA